MFFKAFKFQARIYVIKRPCPDSRSRSCRTPSKSNAGSRQQQRGTIITGVLYDLELRCAPTPTLCWAAASIFTTSFLFCNFILQTNVFLFLPGHRGCIRICYFCYFFFVPRFESLARAFFFIHIADTTRNGVYFVKPEFNGWLMGGGWLGCFIPRLFLDFTFFACAMASKPHSFFFFVLLWSGLLLLVIFFCGSSFFLIFLAGLICFFEFGCRDLAFLFGWLGCDYLPRAFLHYLEDSNFIFPFLY